MFRDPTWAGVAASNDVCSLLVAAVWFKPGQNVKKRTSQLQVLTTTRQRLPTVRSVYVLPGSCAIPTLMLVAAAAAAS